MSVFSAFIGGSYRSQSPTANCSTLINLYVEAMEAPGSKTSAVFYPTPGAITFGSVSQTAGKAFFSTAAADGRTFSVIGLRLYEWFADGSAIERGTVAANNVQATICTNGAGGQQLGICAGGNFYCYDLLTNTLTQVVFLDGRATMAGFIIGYFLVFDGATGTVYQSDLYDGLTFDPLNFFQRNVQADDWVSMFVTSWGQIFLPGSKTRDYYYNAQTFPIPFAPAASGLQTEGCAAPFSVCEVNGRVCWLGTTAGGGYKVYAAQGYAAQRISDHALEFAIGQYARVANAIGETYSDQGHDFYLLKFPGITTWVYDFATGLWHERQTHNAVTGIAEAWRMTFHCFAFNKDLWLDAESGVVYQSSITAPTDIEGRVIVRERTSPAICVQNQMLDIGEFELLMQVGIGNPNPPGEVPSIILQISRDGGITWERERSASVGRIGERLLRVRWQSNGSGRDVAFRVRMSDPVNNYRIMGALLELGDAQGRPISLERAA